MTKKEAIAKSPNLTPTERAALRKTQTKAARARRVAAGKPARKRHYNTRSKPRYTPIAHTSSASRIVASGSFYERGYEHGEMINRMTAGQGVQE
jgi:hypothetical protein